MNDLNQFNEFCFENDFLEISKIENSKIIRRWVVTLSELNLTSTSIIRKLSSLNSFYKYLVKHKLSKVNPVSGIIRPKKGKNLPSFISKESIERLFTVDLFGDDFEGIRDRLIIELLFLTGIRRAELISLKVSNILIFDNSLKVLGKGEKERVIPLTNGLLNSLKLYKFSRDKIENSSDNLFITKKGKDVYPKLIYRVVNKNLRKIATAKKLSPHVLRHTFATYLLNEGANINAIKELLGHSSLASTQIYTHNSFDKLTKVYNNAHPRAK